MPVTEPRVFVSRHVVFYTSAFVAVGAYLCLMALGGYYVREHGGNWGNALQVAFLCGAVAILALLLLSDSPLRRLRVLQPHEVTLHDASGARPRMLGGARARGQNVLT
jgi:hypothetical protein